MSNLTKKAWRLNNFDSFLNSGSGVLTGKLWKNSGVYINNQLSTEFQLQNPFPNCSVEVPGENLRQF